MIPFGAAVELQINRGFRLAWSTDASQEMRLICNSMAAPHGITPSVNASTDKGSAPRVIQFSACLSRFLQVRGFSIILPAGIALDTFGHCIRISWLASVDQANRKPQLICNSTAAPNGITPSINASTDKKNAPRAIQFGACLPQFLQKIWEADPAEGSVWLSKWDISDAFHRCPLQAAHIGAFTYVVPPPPL